MTACPFKRDIRQIFSLEAPAIIKPFTTAKASVAGARNRAIWSG